MEKPNDQDLIAGYIANYRAKDAEEKRTTSWAFMYLYDLIQDDPERLWLITLEMIRQTADAATLFYIAAGPLEDLLAYHGDRLIDRVEQEARTDRHFAQALAGVWGHSRFAGDVYSRVKATCSLYSPNGLDSPSLN